MNNLIIKRGDQARELAVTSHNQLIESVNQFALYVDDTGAKSTSPKGQVLSINSAIKRYYGVSRDDMPRDMLLHVSSVLLRVVDLFDHGMKTHQTRAEIKLAVRNTIKASGESYHAITGVNNGYSN
jgi:hypothetical protein